MILGIDLGTTNSLAAVWRDGAATLIPNALGSVLTPSAVSVAEGGVTLVGQAARDRLSTQPGRSADSFKRAMGPDTCSSWRAGRSGPRSCPPSCSAR